MKINKSDALFLYKLICKYSSDTDSLSVEEFERLCQLSEDLEEFILSGSDNNDDSSTCSDEDEEYSDNDEDHDDDDDDDDDDDPQTDPDMKVSSSTLEDLEPITVCIEGGKSVILEFEEYNGKVDVLLELGSSVISDVELICLTKEKLSIRSTAGWNSFEIKNKLPKSWTEHLQFDKLCEVVVD